MMDKVRHSFPARLLILLCLMGLVAALLVAPVSAGRRDGLSFNVSCDGFASLGGGIVLNRDNTGIGREAFYIIAHDGAGSIIYGPEEESFVVGGSLYIDPGIFFIWATPPQANPLTVQVVSLAGNDLGEQIIYERRGICSGLPGVVQADQVVLPADGVTGEGVSLNATAPQPENEYEVVERQTGYAIVNIENAYLRSGDGPDYEIVALVHGGDRLFVLGRNNRFTWWYVQAGDIRGWINAELVILRGDLTDVPVVPVLGRLRPPSIFLYQNNPILVVPVDNAPAVCTVAGNLDYLIVGRSRTATEWYQIEALCDGQVVTGWIRADRGGLRYVNNARIPITHPN